MIVLKIILIFVVSYFILMYGLSLLIIPNLLYHRKPKDKLPEKVYKDMKEMGRKIKSKRKLVEEVCEYMLKRFHGGLAQTWFYIPFLFEKSIRKIWDKKGYLHCYQHARILRHLLIKTKRFTNKDIKVRLSSVYIEIHQYDLVKVEGGWVKTDPFAMSCGYPFGETLPIFVFQDMKKRGITPRKINKQSKRKKRK